MPERTVSVGLRANVAGFVAGIKTAQGSVASFTKELETNAKRKQALLSVGNAAGVVGLAFGAMTLAAGKSAADFDKAMSSVQAATHQSGRAMESLRQLALDMGAKTAYSATEAAGGIEALSKAGVSTSDILRGGLRGALSLAAAGTIDVQDAAESAATAMTQFGLNGQDVPHVADLLAAAAGKAQGEVGDFSQALDQAGLVANQTGLTIEETMGSLAAFASKGLIGSDAGTSFKTFLQSLTPSSTKAKELMDDLGISAYDAQGNFIGLSKYAGVLRDGLSDLSVEQRNAALKTIFGSDSVRAATVLYDEGAKGVQGWINKVNDAGYAAQTAGIKQDNLAGDLEKLKGAFDTLLIGTGEGAQSPLRGIAQAATGAVDALNELPGPLKAAGFWFGAIATVTGGAAFLGTRFLANIAEAKVAMSELGISAQVTKQRMIAVGTRVGVGAIGGMALAFNHLDESSSDATRALGSFINIAGSAALGFSVGGPWGAAVGGAIGLIGAFANAESNAGVDVSGLTETLNQQTGAVTHNTQEWAAKKLQDAGAFDAAKTLGIGLDTVTKAAIGQDDVLPSLRKHLEDVLRAGTTTDLHTGAKVYDDNAQAAQKLLGVLGATNGALATSKQRLRDNNEALGRNKGATEDSTGAVEDETSALEENIRAHNRRTDALLAGIDKNVAWEQAVDDAAKEARKGTKTLNINTQAGRDNVTALADMANNWNELPDATKRAEGGIKSARQEFIRIAEQMGADKQRAQELARELLDIPNPKRKVEVDTEGASRDVDNFVSNMARKLSDIDDEDVHIDVKSSILQLAAMGQGPLRGMAFGGPVVGGTAGRDSVPIMGMPGEHMFTKSDVDKAGGQRAMFAIRKMIQAGEFARKGDLQYMAAGGPVMHMPVRQQGLEHVVDVAQAQADAVAALIGKRLSKRITQMYQFGGGRPLGPGGTLSMGQALVGQRFAQSQAGLPYQWGGTGNPSWDCSGFVGGVLLASLGQNPRQRIGTTASMPWSGFSPGAGIFTTGTDPGSHMDGNVGGLGIESRGGDGVTLGSGITPISSFARMDHYDSGGVWSHGTAGVNMSGRDELVLTQNQARRFFGGSGGGSGGSKSMQVVGAKMRITNWREGWADVEMVVEDRLDARESHSRRMAGMR